jgi:sulfonate transport system substrate-binding protein
MTNQPKDTLPADAASAGGTISRRQLLKRAALLGLALPLGAGLAGCGAGRQPAAGAPGASAQKTVRLGWGKGGLTLYAKTRGAFEQALAAQGLKAEWVGPFPNHAPSLQAVTGGSADFSFGGSSTPALAAILGGSPLVFTSLALSEPRTTAIIARKDSDIQKVPDLVGKKVAVNRSGLGEFMLVAALEKYQVPRDKVEVVFLNPPDAAPALAEGKIDAWSIWSGPREIAEVEYGARPIFVEGDELPREQQIDVGSFLVLEEYAKQNPETVRAVIAAYRAEAEWSNTHPDEAAALLAKESGWKKEVVDRIVAYKRTTEIISPGDTKIFDLQKAADWLAERKVIPSKIVVADHVANLA